MAAIRSIEDISRKWAETTPQRSGEYEKGVQSPLTDWKTATSAAAPAYKDGVTQALGQGRFEKGVNRAGTAKWQRGATEKGVQRWGQGVQLAQGDYAAGFAPFAAAIKGLQLPPRFARRDPRNLQRVAAVVNLMQQTAAARG